MPIQIQLSASYPLVHLASCPFLPVSPLSSTLPLGITVSQQPKHMTYSPLKTDNPTLKAPYIPITHLTLQHLSCYVSHLLSGIVLEHRLLC